MVHPMQRDRRKTIDTIRKWVEAAGAEVDLLLVENRAMRELGCTRERAKIYIQEALYK